MKQTTAFFLACLLALPAWAQEPSSARPVRVRITGVSTYEVPGVIRLEGSHVSGSPVRVTDRFVQFRRPGDGRLLTVLRPGRRLAGYSRTIGEGLVEFVLDGEKEPLYVPSAAIAKSEPAESETRAGEGARARITGVGTYEIPGVIKVEADRVSGTPVRITESFVQFRRPGDGRVVTVLRPGKRLTGHERLIGDGLVEFVLKGEKEPLYVLSEAIAKSDPPLSGMGDGKGDRVRITGVGTYEIPGVVKLEGNQISGILVRNTDRYVQVRRSDDGQLLTLLKPQQELTGRAKPVSDSLLEIVPDGEKEALYVPLDAITKTDWPGMPDVANSTLVNITRFVQPGQRIEVVSRGGSVVVGGLARVSEAGVALDVEGRTIDLPVSAVTEIISRRRDPVNDGAVKGLVAGLLGALLFCGGGSEMGEGFGDFAQVLLPLGAGIGAGLGAAIDAASEEVTVIFRAGETSRVTSAPILTGSGWEVALRLRF